MKFSEVIGQTAVKERLRNSVSDGRISHAQLFLAPEGSGGLALAMAYAQYISCTNKIEEDSCGECLSCIKFNKLVHPDLHLVFPVAIVKDKRFCKEFLPEFRTAFLGNPYLGLFDWLEELGVENKQGNINAEEANEIIKTLSLKTYESEYKIMVIWMAEKMNISSGNKLLKILEEPPDKTLFLMVCENQDQLLRTILSRTQLIKIHKLTDGELASFLINNNSIPEQQAKEIARLSDGNINEALKLVENTEADQFNFVNFRQWMRSCYVGQVPELIHWVEALSLIGRERQKNFLTYSLHALRETLMMNIGSTELVRLSGEELDFTTKFSPFIHRKNVPLLSEEFSKAHYEIERNANPKILFLDLTFKVMNLLKIPNTP